VLSPLSQPQSSSTPRGCERSRGGADEPVQETPLAGRGESRLEGALSWKAAAPPATSNGEPRDEQHDRASERRGPSTPQQPQQAGEKADGSVFRPVKLGYDIPWLEGGSSPSGSFRPGARGSSSTCAAWSLMKPQLRPVKLGYDISWFEGGSSPSGSFRPGARGSSRTCAAWSLMKPQLRHVNGKACVPRSTAELPRTWLSSTRSSHPSQSLLPQNGHSRRAPRLRRNANIGRTGLIGRAGAISEVAHTAPTGRGMPRLPTT